MVYPFTSCASNEEGGCITPEPSNSLPSLTLLPPLLYLYRELACSSPIFLPSSYPLLPVHDRWCAVIPSFSSLLCLFSPRLVQSSQRLTLITENSKKTIMNSSKRQLSTFVEVCRLVFYICYLYSCLSPLLPPSFIFIWFFFM